MSIPETAETELTAIAASGDSAALIEAVAELTTAALEPRELADSIPELLRTVTPQGWTEKLHDLEPYAETPRRKRGHVQLGTTESLARYLTVHRTSGTTLYADGDEFMVTAVINDHEIEGAGHRDHRATLTLEQTPGCLRWVNAHSKYLSQQAFAQLIEDGITEIARPEGATLLELVQTIHATNNATFRSGYRLQDGQVQFEYVNNSSAGAGATGDVAIPETITLVFEPFYGSEPIQIEARLRYRIADGNLALGVWLIRHVEEIRKAFETELANLAEKTADAEQDGLVALDGSPE